jgi:NarL family two-component system response regulator LiaR
MALRIPVRFSAGLNDKGYARLMISILLANSNTQTLPQETLSYLSQQEDFLVLEVAEDRRHIIAALGKFRPDLVLLSCDLLTRSQQSKLSPLLKGLHEAKGFVMCGHSDPRHAERAAELGMRGILDPQASPECLCKAIRAVHGGDWWFSRKTLGDLFSKALINQSASRKELELGHTHVTDREYEIIRLVAEGNTNKEVGVKLGVSPRTVKCHLNNIFQKLHINRRAQLFGCSANNEAQSDIPPDYSGPDKATSG